VFTRPSADKNVTVNSKNVTVKPGNVTVKTDMKIYIDDILVWHGGMNLLGKEDVWDNLIRIKNPDVAAELLEIAMQGN
jgi:hypothetical protein